MAQIINRLMGEQIKIKYCFFIMVAFFHLQSNAQINNCTPLKFLKDVETKSFKPNEKIKIIFQNVSQDTIQYQIDVLMLSNNQWLYSPYYTKYFNHDLSYIRMKKLLSSKYPVVFSKNYYHPTGMLKPSEIESLCFTVEKTETFKQFIKFRLHVLNGKDNCDVIISAPFYFVKIKE